MPHYSLLIFSQEAFSFYSVFNKVPTRLLKKKKKKKLRSHCENNSFCKIFEVLWHSHLELELSAIIWPVSTDVSVQQTQYSAG